MSALQVSIIIATRNREAILWQTVRKAEEAAIGKNVEIIIVNDGDHSLEIPDKIENKVMLFENPGKGVTAARNFGAFKATGDILFFIDDDMWINAEGLNWIFGFMQGEESRKSVYNLNWQYPEVLYAKLRESKVGRFILNASYDCMWGRMKESGEQPTHGLYRCKSIASCSLVIDKNLFNRVGRYKEEFIFQGEDLELSRRLNSLAVPIYAVFEVLLYHNHQDRLQIDGYLQRLKQGYQSEFAARTAGWLPKEDDQYNGFKKYAFESFRITEPFWIFLHKILPNIPALSRLNMRLVGMLAGLQKFKQWKVNSLT